MSLFSWLTGPVGGIIGSVATGLLNNKGAEDRQEDAQSYNSAQFASRYQTTVKDMEAAGLNPGLAYGGISGSPSPAGIASSAGFPDMGASFNEGARAKAQVDLQSAQVANINADTANKDAQGKLYEAQAAAAMGSANQADANVTLIGQQVQKIKAEIPLLNAQTLNADEQREVLFRTANMLYEQANLMKEQGKTQPFIRDQLNSLAGKLVSDTVLNNLDIEAASKFDNMGREAGQLKPFFDILRMFIRR